MSQFQSRTLEIRTIHALLSSDTRRIVLCRLQQVERTTASALGRHVADHADDPGAPDRPDRRDTTIALIHNHLPRLDAHDVIEYDRSEHTVTPGPNFGEIEPFVDRSERHDGE